MSNLYCANDKAISDALNQTKVTKSDVADLFYSRGIILSPETKRKQVADQFSMLFHDYYDYVKLSRILGSTNRREKQSASYIDSNQVTLDNIEAAAHNINDSLKDFDAVSNVKRTGNSLEFVIHYRVTNFNASEFRQVSDREAVITFTEEDGKISIRGPYNETIDKVKQTLIKAVADEVNDEEHENEKEDINIQTINLRGIEDSIKRTNFFRNIVNKMDGVVLHDVTDVFIYHPKVSDDQDQDLDSEDEQDIDIGVHITKASLKGEKVLESEELQSLYDKGFFIWKIIWQSKENSYDSDIYEFEAQFNDPDNFENFTYLARGFYRYKAKGEYNNSKTAFTKNNERYFGRKIEKAAIESIDIISAQDTEDDEDGQV
ncbi:hypothetical protein [Marinobacterium stanieri]|uniref:Uncharacterized protein n=1 Tax=Marinobacterium stanieri TaxID=49186 RepID=A0A1N6W6M2_9GAMM|nr:hypothetical protein [Marinobacterium stanieri]SIQ85744.1 hypothetical protein SAMN05421647_11011 [Marinobacterium stanieri]